MALAQKLYPCNKTEEKFMLPHYTVLYCTCTNQWYYFDATSEVVKAKLLSKWKILKGFNPKSVC